MINVLIIDDSTTARSVLRAILETSREINVCGEAEDAFEARKLIKELRPDVITLDIEMPRMDGITFLRNLMRLHPLPTIMVSTLTVHGSAMSVEALSIGAVDCIHKPNLNEFDSIASEIISKIVNAAKANVLNTIGDYGNEIPQIERSCEYISNRLIAIGASTGGVQAVEHVILRFPPGCPPVVMAQHIPEYFAITYAKRMNDNYPNNFCIAEDQQPIESGNIYLAPGDQHLEIVKKSGRYQCKLHSGERVCYHRPSVDVLFNSVADVTNGNATAALLTGMGEDGAQGLLKMKNSGCITVVQDEASSLVWGMPGAAVKLDAANKIVPLDQVALELLDSCYKHGDANGY